MSAGALPIIRVQNLEKVYPGNVHAVRGVSFEAKVQTLEDTFMRITRGELQ